MLINKFLQARHQIALKNHTKLQTFRHIAEVYLKKIPHVHIFSNKSFFTNQSQPQMAKTGISVLAISSISCNFGMRNN